MRPLPHLNLLSGDRLEPSPQLPDIEAFDLVSSWPVQATFWRRSSEGGAMHRNPLFDANTGVTLDIIAVDTLHTLALGVFKTFVAFSFWNLLASNIFSLPAMFNEEEKSQIVALRLQSRLRQFYSQNRHLSQIGDLNVAMFGKKGKPMLHAKAAETEGLLEFMMEVMTENRQKLHKSGEYLAAGQALIDFRACLQAEPQQMSARGQQAEQRAPKRR